MQRSLRAIVEKADPGAFIRYHVGYLHEGDQANRKEAWKLYEEGLVELVRERDVRGFIYYVVKRKTIRVRK